jgi:Ca2+/Na+ antiporter
MNLFKTITAMLTKSHTITSRNIVVIKLHYYLWPIIFILAIILARRIHHMRYINTKLSIWLTLVLMLLSYFNFHQKLTSWMCIYIYIYIYIYIFGNKLQSQNKNIINIVCACIYVITGRRESLRTELGTRKLKNNVSSTFTPSVIVLKLRDAQLRIEFRKYANEEKYPMNIPCTNTRLR